MKRTMAVVWGSLVLAGAVVAGAETVDREYDESFAVSPGDTLRLLHGDGDVEIKPSTNDRMDVHVRYLMKSRGLGGPRDFEVDFRSRGETSSRSRDGRSAPTSSSVGRSTRSTATSSRLRRTCCSSFAATMATSAVNDWTADITLESSDGDVEIDGLTGDLSIDLDDGDVELYECAVGSATLRLQDGDVTLRGGAGSWRFEVDDGDLDLRDLAAEAVSISAEDGDVELSLLPAAGPEIDIRTDDGDVIPRARARHERVVRAHLRRRLGADGRQRRGHREPARAPDGRHPGRRRRRDDPNPDLGRRHHPARRRLDNAGRLAIVGDTGRQWRDSERHERHSERSPKDIR